VKPIIIGVAGGSGSGKTTVINHIVDTIGAKELVCLQHDSYYRDLKHLSLEERSSHNFDHPASLETELMIRHLHALKEGYQVDVPIYDFTKHVRKEETKHISNTESGARAMLSEDRYCDKIENSIKSLLFNTDMSDSTFLNFTSKLSGWREEFQIN